MKLETLLESVRTTQIGMPDGRWYPARGETAENTFLRLRVRAAWGVLTGRLDAVEWPGGQNKAVWER